MKHIYSAAIILAAIFFPTHLFAGDYEKAWTALLRNDQQTALKLFRKAVKSNDNRDNAIVMAAYLESYNGYRIPAETPPSTELFNNPEPYEFALWFNDIVLGDYGQKRGRQLSALQNMISDTALHGSLKAAANYYAGIMYLTSNKPAEAKASFAKIGALDHWQFVGPFDNINGSGFNKDNGVLSQPVSPAGFVSSDNTIVNWFTPNPGSAQGWVMVMPYFINRSAKGYVQTFVYSAVEQEGIFCLGGNGALKAWLNDKLLIAEQEEARTELDTYQAKCLLKKGYNRVLLQIGYTSVTESPNFIVRITDQKCTALHDVRCSSEFQPYVADTISAAPTRVTHFAEAYFLDQMKRHPDDPAFPFLLSRLYLRAEAFEKAKAIMRPLYDKYPDNPFIIDNYSTCLSPVFEKAGFAELTEKVKQLDPENYWVQVIRYNKLVEEKKYQEARPLIDHLIAERGHTLIVDLKLLTLLLSTEKLDSALAFAKDIYDANRDHAAIVQMMAQLQKQVLRQPDNYVKTIEEYLRGGYNLNLTTALADAYFERNEVEKGIALLQNLVDVFPGELESYEPITKYYFARQQYDSCIYYLKKVTRISPYRHETLAEIANCYMQKNDRQSALAYYKQALTCYSGGFNYRSRIRELESKPDLFNYFPGTDFYKLISDAHRNPYDTSYAFYYISDQRNVIVYKDGSNEQVSSTSIKINNKDGVDRWKELTISYDDDSQEGQIIKAEVVKANSSRVPADISGNQIVFTKLEPGDAIFFTYKISSHAGGRLGREFWDKFYFNAAVPTKEACYNLLIEKEFPLTYLFVNGESRPVQGEKENFHTYSWKLKDLAAVHDESYMPVLDDIGKVLHLTTVKNWDVIGEWFSDITRMQSREDFELNQSFEAIFPKGVDGLTERERAARIYDFIERNISYSSVAFRQSAYVPQRAGKTLQTKLGDCKDLSTLFLAFARKANLEANLVLMSTRSRGLQRMALPSMDFNHCIIRYKDGNQYHYLELTDPQLPFGVVTTSMANAQILNVAYDYKPNESIRLLTDESRVKAGYIRKVKMKITAHDVEVSTVLQSNADLGRDIRQKFEHKTTEERKSTIESELAGSFKNQVILNHFDFEGLETLADTVEERVDFVAKNEVIEVGDFNMIKPVMIDVVATLGIFSREDRLYPFEYSGYESADVYKTTVEVELPEGQEFENVPSDVDVDFMKMKYSIKYKRDGKNRLTVERVFSTDRTQRLTASDFKKMESMFNTIVSAEGKYLSFKAVK